MDILFLIKNKNQANALDLIKTKIVEFVKSDNSHDPKLHHFDWKYVYSSDEFVDYSCHRIDATGDQPHDAAHYIIADPVKILKSKDLKQSFWGYINDELFPIFLKTTTPIGETLNMSPAQLQDLLRTVSESKAAFEVVHPDGYTISVNSEGGDVSLTTGDLASMLAASWLFGSKVNRLL